MLREEAYKLLNNHIKDLVNLNHSIETEAIMRKLALYLGEDEERWGVLGLLHDIDWELTQDNISQHGVKAVEILKQAGADQEIIDIIVSHTFGTECGGNKEKSRSRKIEHLLAASETITGLIFACALVHPDKKLANVKVKSIKKKIKDKSFAAKVNREVIKECEKAGIELDKFIEISLKAMQEIAGQIEL